MAKSQILDIIRANDSHVRFMVDNIYPADKIEIETHGCTVEEGVKFSYQLAGQSWVAMSEDGPVCMWGLSRSKSLLGGASAWLITSTLIDKYSRSFIRQAKPYIHDMCATVGYVQNYVDSRHARALRFFEWLGFTVDRDSDMLIGPEKIPFYKICLRMHYGR